MPILGIFRVVPAWAYKLLAVMVLLAGVFFAGEYRVQRQWDASIKAQKAKVQVVLTKQQAATDNVQKVQVKAEEKVHTVFKDRVIYKTKVVPHEVIVKEDADCIIPDRFISMWNSANSGEVPNASSSIDAAASGSREIEGTR